MDSQEALFLHTFPSVYMRPAGVLVGAMKPVHISVWADMFEGAVVTVTFQGTRDFAATLWGEDHKEFLKLTSIMYQMKTYLTDFLYQIYTSHNVTK